MKKLFAFLALVALTSQAQTTFTNGIKGSALTSATTPLGGSELVYLIQSGTSKTATVSQVIAAATSQDNATTNGLVALILANTARDTTTSNTLTASVTAANAAITATTNGLAALILANTARDTATSNTLTASLTAATAANTATSNSIAGTAATVANAAVALYAANGATNGGSASLSSLSVTNLTYPVLAFGNYDGSSSVSPFVVNLAAASFQTVTFTNHSASYLGLSGIAPGENVTVVIKNGYTSSENFYYPACIQISSGASGITISAGKYAVFNFVATGSGAGYVYCSAAAQQN